MPVIYDKFQSMYDEIARLEKEGGTWTAEDHNRWIRELFTCEHKVRQWRAHEDGWYRLYCVNCGEYLKAETALPCVLDPFIVQQLNIS